MRIMAQTAEEISMKVYRGETDIPAVLKHDGSPVTEADSATEYRLIEELTALLPGAQILGEETVGEKDAWKESPLLHSAGDIWIIDPIDGTIDYRAKRSFGMLVGLRQGGTIRMAIAYYPVEQEFIWAMHEIEGAFYCAIENIQTGKISAPRPLKMPQPKISDTEIGYFIGHNDNRSLANIMNPAALEIFAGMHISVCVVTAMRRLLLQGNYACLYNNYKPWDFETTGYITRKAGGVSVRFDGTPSRTASDAHNVILAPTADVAKTISSNILQLWMVVRTDLHGTKNLVDSGYLFQAEAQGKIDSIRAGWSSEHKQTFSIYDYKPTKLMQRLKELEVNF